MKKLRNGFTLVELLIAVVVGLVIMAAIYAMVNMGQGSAAGVGRKVVTQQDARAVLDFMATEIAMASFNPTLDLGVWSTIPTACINSPIPTSKGIQDASANSILIAMDLNQDGAIVIADNEAIRYTYNSGNGTITRSVNCLDTETILGGDNSATMVINNVGTPVFQYLDSAGAVTANPANIRRIRITIVAEVEDKQGAYNKAAKTYSTDVLVRNHVLSP
ncbi:MAG: PilW family protein [Smithellaceae bacterium]